MLAVHANTLRRHESADGRWCTIQGQQFRVYREGIAKQAPRRYSLSELERVRTQIVAEAAHKANRRPWWA